MRGAQRAQDLRRSFLLARLRALYRLRAATHLWRSSLQLRVTASTLVGGTMALLLLGVFFSDRVRDGLYEQRVEQLLAESARTTQQAQATLDSALVSTQGEAQDLINDLVPFLQVSGSGPREVFLRRSPSDVPAVFVNDVFVGSALRELVTPALRSAVQGSDEQRWVPVAVPQDDGDVEPGVVVGSAVTVPVVGQYELYYLYSLAPEQRTLSFVQQVLLVAGIGLVALLGGMTWLVTRQAVHPVRVAARVAERLADGHLAERMRVRGEDEVASLGRSFNEMAESLQDQIFRMEELSHLQRRFVSDVSHELRTPLTTIRMAAEVIYEARADLDPAAERSAELLAAQLDRFEDLLADLLEISRFDAGAAVLDAERRDVREVVTGAVEQAAPLAERRGVRLQVDIPAAPVIADVDPRRVERVLRNLLVNAVEHAEGRPVEVRLGADARAVAVTVRDHGVGMTQEEAEHVFDRFWRADPARARTTGGTGLGLAISVEDAHLHGGWLEVWGRPAKGACFRLTLPRRAGIALTGSPLPLEPPAREQAPARSVVQEGSPAALDPTTVPDLDHVEVR